MIKIIIEAIKLALYSFRRDKFRTLLSLSAVMIGVFSIVAILSAVDTMKRSVNKGLNSFGASTVYIQKIPWNNIYNLKAEDIIKRKDISYDDYKYLSRNLESSEVMAYSLIFNPEIIVNSKKYKDANVLVCTSNINNFLNVKYAYGRPINFSEYESGSSLAIIGNHIYKTLFEEGSLVDEDFYMGKYYMKINNEKVAIVGVLKAEGENIASMIDVDKSIIIPYKYGKKVFPIKGISGMIMTKPSNDIVLDEEFISQISLLLRKKRGVSPKKKDDFSINRMSMLMEKLSAIFTKINIAGWIIAAFSLLIGGFGIANIMYVSVNERRKQIGVQKAVGAKSRDIMLQYLSESAFISIMGGILAIGLVYLISILIRGISDFPYYVSLKNILIGLILSFFIGILSGILPSRHACKLDPVIAMS